MKGPITLKMAIFRIANLQVGPVDFLEFQLISRLEIILLQRVNTMATEPALSSSDLQEFPRLELATLLFVDSPFRFYSMTSRGDHRK